MNAGNPKVTVFGSLHYDITVHGPARPRTGETVTGHAWAPKCGGKGGNQAVSAARSGAPVTMLGAVGDDAFGQTLIANLDRRGVDRRFVRISPGAESGMSVAIFDAEGDYGAVIVSGVNLTLGEDDVRHAATVLANSSILILQNEIPDAANVLAAEVVRAAGGKVLLNAAPARALSEALKSLVDILVVNAIEAEFLSPGSAVETLDGALQTARRLTRVFPAVVVTAGGEGVAFADQSGRALVIAGERIAVQSTHGAGDEFVGALAAMLAAGVKIEAALHAANHAAAILVATPESQRL